MDDWEQNSLFWINKNSIQSCCNTIVRCNKVKLLYCTLVDIFYLVQIILS